MIASSARPVLPARPRLAFVETADQAQEALDGWISHRLDAAVALEPAGAGALRAAGRAYLTLEDGYEPRAICDLADPILMRQQAWAGTVDDWLWRRVPAFSESGFRPARLYLYWLKVMFDSLAIRVHPVTWALERWQPSWVWHPGPAIADRQFGWDLMFRQSLYIPVLRSVATRLRIEARLPEAAPSSPIEAASSGVPHWRMGRGLSGWMAQGQRALWKAVRSPRPGALGRRIVASNTYDLAPVWREAARAGIPLDAWSAVVERHRKVAAPGPSDAMSEIMRSAWSDAVEGAGLFDPTLTEGCDLGQAANDRMRFWWEVLVPEQWSVYRAVRDERDHVPAAVVVSGLGDHIERGIFSAYRSLGARTVIYQHGGFVGACECPPWDCNDLWLADCELTYGEGATAYFSDRTRRYRDSRAVPVSVGSSRLDSWRSNLRGRRGVGRRPRVLLVPTIIPFNNRYFDAGTLPDVLESELQVALVDAARDFPGCDFIYKAFPSSDQHDTPAIKQARQGGSNCRVVIRRPLPRLLERADFIVLTFPSTALLETLLTDRPILVLADPRFVMMRPDALRALERRAHVAADPCEFIASYRRLLEQRDFGPIAEPDDTFLKQYGTHLGDGRSAARALDAIGAPLPPRSGSVDPCLEQI